MMRIQGLRCHAIYCQNGARLNVIPVLASRSQALRYADIDLILITCSFNAVSAFPRAACSFQPFHVWDYSILFAEGTTSSQWICLVQN